MGRPRKEQLNPEGTAATLRNEGYIAEINGVKYYRLPESVEGRLPDATAWEESERNIEWALTGLNMLTKYLLGFRDIAKQCLDKENEDFNQWHKAEVSGTTIADINRIAVDYRNQVSESHATFTRAYSHLMNLITLKGSTYEPFDFGKY